MRYQDAYFTRPHSPHRTNRQNKSKSVILLNQTLRPVILNTELLAIPLRGGHSRRTDGTGRPLCRAVRHVFPASVGGLRALGIGSGLGAVGSSSMSHPLGIFSKSRDKSKSECHSDLHYPELLRRYPARVLARSAVVSRGGCERQGRPG